MSRRVLALARCEEYESRPEDLPDVIEEAGGSIFGHPNAFEALEEEEDALLVLPHPVLSRSSATSCGGLYVDGGSTSIDEEGDAQSLPVWGL